MTKRTNPGDVANSFVRCLLADIGDALGGFSQGDWETTLEYFDNRCAYSGQPLDTKTVVRDHVIPHNKEHCGLHIFGNIVPATREANNAKGSRNFREFILNDNVYLSGMDKAERERRFNRLNEFLTQSGYLL